MIWKNSVVEISPSNFGNYCIKIRNVSSQKCIFSEAEPYFQTMGWGQWGTIQSLEDVQCACELRESGFGHGSTFSLSAATRETPSPTIFLCLIFTRLGLTKNCNILEFLRIGYRSYRIGFMQVPEKN